MDPNLQALKSIAIDPDLPMARYYQLSSELRRLIREGVLKPGDQLPSIPDLCDVAGLSRNTVVRALSELSRSRDIVTRRGLGCYVAEEQKLQATEFLIHANHPQSNSYRNEYFDALLRGAMVGFKDPDRRVIVSYTCRHAPDLVELESVMRARQADSLIAYRPNDELMEPLRLLSERAPVSSLFYPIPGGCADAVVTAADVPLRKLLLERIERGEKRFAFLGIDRFDRNDRPDCCPYRQIRKAFAEVMAEAGIEPADLCARVEGEADIPAVEEWVGALPEGTFVVTHLGLPALTAREDLEYAMYTEYARTLLRHQRRGTLLYLDLNRLAAAAAGQILDRLSGRATGEGRVLGLEPDVLLPGSGAKASSGAAAERAADLTDIAGTAL